MNEMCAMEATVELPPQKAIFPINASNAAELQRKSAETRKANNLAREQRENEIRQQEEDRLLALLPFKTNPLHSKVVEQIEQIDEAMADCKPRELAAFAQAKATLWKLLFPQPKAGRTRREFERAEPIDPGA
jgi:hypothetical protein